MRLALPLLLSALLLFAAPPVRAEAEGQPPTAENLELRVICGSGVIGRLSADDADGDLVGFTVTTGPVRGELLVKADGRFLYLSRARHRGWDYFGYRACDAQGHLSQEATVIIRVEKA